MAWILEECGGQCLATLEVSDLEILIPLCLLESLRGPVATLLMEEGAMKRWRKGRPTQESGYMSPDGSGPLAVKSSSHKS